MQRNNDFPSYSAKSPAFVVFMIDQTASMMNVSLGGGDRAEIAAINVQNAIIEILNRCISGINIKPRAYISVIGYGGQVGETAEIIREGWANDWAEDIVKAKTNKECIFPIIANGAASMNEGFRLAEDLCNNWTFGRKDTEGMGSVIIINLTKGTTIDIEDTHKYAFKIMSQNALLYNIVIPAEGELKEDILFPDYNPFDKDTSRNWIFDISSLLPKDIVETAKCQTGLVISSKSRGLIVSPSYYSAARICDLSLIIKGKPAFMDDQIIR